MIKACLFDLDGVIVDTAKYHYTAWKRLANDLGFDICQNDNESLKGISRMASLEILLEKGGIYKTQIEKQKLANIKNNHYLSYIANMQANEILPGAKEFIMACREAGISTAIGSSSKNATTIINRLNLTELFDAIIDGNQILNAKPHPDVFLKGAKALGIEAKNCIVFEDAQAGINAAHKAHMKCVAIDTSGKLHNADLIIDGLHQMNINRLRKL